MHLVFLDHAELKITLERCGVSTSLTMFVEPENAARWQLLLEEAR